ncbi:hypothetical protein TWF569_010712 [Orbilia oligospora]|nr:hypothetical protein TWF569_010712 [Orbilia oligospora]
MRTLIWLGLAGTGVILPSIQRNERRLPEKSKCICLFYPAIGTKATPMFAYGDLVSNRIFAESIHPDCAGQVNHGRYIVIGCKETIPICENVQRGEVVFAVAMEMVRSEVGSLNN